MNKRAREASEHEKQKKQESERARAQETRERERGESKRARDETEEESKRTRDKTEGREQEIMRHAKGHQEVTRNRRASSCLTQIRRQTCQSTERYLQQETLKIQHKQPAILPQKSRMAATNHNQEKACILRQCSTCSVV